MDKVGIYELANLLVRHDQQSLNRYGCQYKYVGGKHQAIYLSK